MSKKLFKDYKEKYGSLSDDLSERLIYIIEHYKLSMKNIKSIRNKIIQRHNTIWHDLNIIIYFTPHATPRAKYSRFTKKFYVSGAKDHSDLMMRYVNDNLKNFGIITTPCKLDIRTYSPTPSSMNREDVMLSELQYIYNVSTPDWDNLGKTYSDMIQKKLILNDSIIIDGRVRKFYSIKPRIEIKISFMEDYDSKYNKNKIEKSKYYNDMINKGGS